MYTQYLQYLFVPFDLHLTICTVFIKYLDKLYQYILLIIQKKYREYTFVNGFFPSYH